MKIIKRIIYTLLGLILTGAVALVGIILFAEYSGRHFTADSVWKAEDGEYSEEDSRLVFDENGNIAEFPDSTAESDTVPAESTLPADNASEENSSPRDDTSADAGSSADDSTERRYVMDMGSNLFHTADCPDAQNIKAEDISEMTTTRAKILNAGYQPCKTCNP